MTQLDTKSGIDNSSAGRRKSTAGVTFPSSRPQLIFKHNPKAGGGSIKELLQQLKPNFVYAWDAFPEFYEDMIDTTPVQINPNDTLILIPEFNRVRKHHRQKGFVISHMREPCDQYLSLWAFGSKGKGGLYEELKMDNYNFTVDAYGHDSPTFDTKEDIRRFQHKWLRDQKVIGLIARRHRESYGRPNVLETADGGTRIGTPDSVDCWVYVDDFQATIYSCLREYEMQGGLVDWDTPLLSDLTTDLQETNKKRELEKYTKNDLVGNPQLSHHSKCPTYYDNATADIVQMGAESFIFEAYGYQGCCGGRNPKNTLIHPPQPLFSSREVNVTSIASAPVQNRTSNGSSNDANGIVEVQPIQLQESISFQYPSSSQSLLALFCVPVVVLVLIFAVRKILLKQQGTGHLQKYAVVAQQDEEKSEDKI